MPVRQVKKENIDDVEDSCCPNTDSTCLIEEESFQDSVRGFDGMAPRGSVPMANAVSQTDVPSSNFISADDTIA